MRPLAIEDSQRLVLDVLAQYNKGLLRKIDLSQGSDTPLSGKDSILDSVQLVGLIMAVEDRLSTEPGCGVSLVDERAMSREPSPFATVGTLAAYIAEHGDPT
ncbi:MAG: hypothetical protein A2506_13440 [Elusimicrobia bacterium RIFOXYD12_FULL_66_9]|nr:MAG: hypothetical protein A2506_13440 [Elusimicrobia bacterium RIFOXYD12_FULL_66_9]